MNQQRQQISVGRSVGLGVLLCPILLFAGCGYVGNGVAHFFGWW